MKHCLLFISTLVIGYLQAQDIKRTAVWYFGANAGINFNTSPPSVLTDGAMNTVEGCATICDINGNLLFYTNGVTVWNKSHNIMQNGTGLYGHVSSTQAALIIPQPGNDSVFFVFTTYALGSFRGLNYTVVNINPNNGLGRVEDKNIQLYIPVAEKLTATHHANERDIWVMVKGYGDSLYYAYLVTDKGVIECPVISAIGPKLPADVTTAQGEIKFSYDEKRLASCFYVESTLPNRRVEFMDFDNSSGKLSNYSFIPNVILPYSLEFSPNNEVLYVTNRFNYVYQFDLNLKNGDSINKYRKQLYFPNNTSKSFHNIIQRGLDDRLYVALVDSTFISTIDNPNSFSNPQFNLNGFSIAPKKSWYGLPNFVRSYFDKPALQFGYNFNCASNTADFRLKDTLQGRSYRWYFRHNSSGSTDSFTTTTLSYSFNNTGEYKISLIANGSTADTVIKTVYIHPKYSLDLGADTAYCNTDSVLLTAGPSGYCYLWQDSSANNAFTVKQSGTYRVRVNTPGFCTYFDTVKITLHPATITKIQGTKDSLYINGNFTNHRWFFKGNVVSTSAFVIPVANGQYHAVVTDSNGCKTYSDTANVVGVGLSDVNTTNFFVYPNPFEETITITGSFEGVAEVFSFDGRVLFSETITSGKNQYSLSVNPGIYLLKITTNNHQLHYLKIIKR